MIRISNMKISRNMKYKVHCVLFTVHQFPWGSGNALFFCSSYRQASQVCCDTTNHQEKWKCYDKKQKDINKKSNQSPDNFLPPKRQTNRGTWKHTNCKLEHWNRNDIPLSSSTDGTTSSIFLHPLHGQSANQPALPWENEETRQL